MLIKKRLASYKYISLMGYSHLFEVISSDDVRKLLDNINKICTEIKESNRTAKLWIQYFELVQIKRLFVRSERIGTFTFVLLTRCFHTCMPQDTCTVLNPRICTYNRWQSFQQKLTFCLQSQVISQSAAQTNFGLLCGVI